MSDLLSVDDLPRGHDFASAGWEQRAEFPDLYTWFCQAVDDLIEFDTAGG